MMGDRSGNDNAFSRRERRGRGGSTARTALLAILGSLASAVLPAGVSAEPYLAVAAGLKCAACHVNPSGGGKRNVFGNGYAQSEVAQRIVSLSEGDASRNWTGEVNRWLSVGGDLRSGLDYVDTPGVDEHSEFGVSRATLYAAVSAVPNLLTVYLDEHVEPGEARAREAYALLTPAGGKYTVKAGKFFLPFGLRLQDDSAFVREASGVNFNTPDSGIEGGLELPRWSAQLAITNGTAGGPENDSMKQSSVQASYVRPGWRLGAAYNFNNAALGDREMVGVFGGLRTGPIAWLAEVDVITDDLPGGAESEHYASLLEGNWLFGKGHNLKLSYEFCDPDDDTDEDERERYSLVWEYTPLQFLQSRIGVRAYNGVPDDAPSNRDEVFAELHVYF
jgi:hypothetical protein